MTWTADIRIWLRLNHIIRVGMQSVTCEWRLCGYIGISVHEACVAWSWLLQPIHETETVTNINKQNFNSFSQYQAGGNIRTKGHAWGLQTFRFRQCGFIVMRALPYAEWRESLHTRCFTTEYTIPFHSFCPFIAWGVICVILNQLLMSTFRLWPWLAWPLTFHEWTYIPHTNFCGLTDSPHSWCCIHCPYFLSVSSCG